MLRPSIDFVHLPRSEQSEQFAAKLASPPPSLLRAICTARPAGQVTVSVFRSTRKASLPNRPEGADGRCTFTLASVRPKHPIASPFASLGSQRRFCASLP